MDTETKKSSGVGLKTKATRHPVKGSKQMLVHSKKAFVSDMKGEVLLDMTTGKAVSTRVTVRAGKPNTKQSRKAAINKSSISSSESNKISSWKYKKTNGTVSYLYAAEEAEYEMMIFSAERVSKENK